MVAVAASEPELTLGVQLAERALSAMRENGISPTPANFAIWYTYFEGTNPALNNIIDRIMRSDGVFTEARNRAIFVKHCQNPLLSLPLEAFVETFLQQTANLTSSLNQARVSVSDFDRNLVSASEQVASAAEVSSLRGVIVDLLAATREVASHNHALEHRINECGREIDRLRCELIEARRNASLDGLTGLANRASFENTLGDVIAQNGEEHAISLLFVDIDHFKQFNDRFGHSIGDLVLRLLARVLTDNVKGQDLAARYGGEEFVVLLPKTDLADALRLARKICTVVSERRITSAKTADDYGRLTVSIGVACYRAGECSKEFVDRADKAMYLAKRSGRNRVVAEDCPATPSLHAGR